jgi:hypothetical protein
VSLAAKVIESPCSSRRGWRPDWVVGSDQDRQPVRFIRPASWPNAIKRLHWGLPLPDVNRVVEVATSTRSGLTAVTTICEAGLSVSPAQGPIRDGSRMGTPSCSVQGTMAPGGRTPRPSQQPWKHTITKELRSCVRK